MTATSLGLSNIEIVVRIVLSVVIGSIIGLERGSNPSLQASELIVLFV